MKGLFTVIAILGLSVSLANAQKIGTAAPSFVLTDSNGQVHQLADYAGRFVVLEWFNPDCPFVKAQYNSKNMQTLQQRYVAKGVAWLTVNSAAKGKQGYLTTETAKAVIAKQGLNSTALLFDSDGKVGKLFGARTTPHLFVINPEGKLIYNGAIDSSDSTDPDEPMFYKAMAS